MVEDIVLRRTGCVGLASLGSLSVAISFCLRHHIGPLFASFFGGCKCLSDSCNLLYFCSKDRYFLSCLVHSFLIRSKTCTFFCIEFHGCVFCCFPQDDFGRQFFSTISLLFSLICFSKPCRGHSDDALYHFLECL